MDTFLKIHEKQMFWQKSATAYLLQIFMFVLIFYMKFVTRFLRKQVKQKHSDYMDYTF